MPAVNARFRASIVLAAALFLLGAAVPAAQADLVSTSCDGQQLEQPFLPWGDPASYVLAPGGAFEPGDPAWSLTGDAGVVAGNEPWLVHGGVGGYSLAIRAGSSASSPATCISLAHPTLRFFAHSSGGSPLDTLRVDVVFKTTLGLLSSLPIAIVPASDGWEATLPYAFGINVLAGLSSDYQAVAFRFTPQGSASWQIDDVYVDPWSKG